MIDADAASHLDTFMESTWLMALREERAIAARL